MSEMTRSTQEIRRWTCGKSSPLALW